jgi:hypothetical protein
MHSNSKAQSLSLKGARGLNLAWLLQAHSLAVGLLRMEKKKKNFMAGYFQHVISPASAAILTVTQLEHFEQKRGEVFFCKSPFLFNMDSSGVNGKSTASKKECILRLLSLSTEGIYYWYQKSSVLFFCVKEQKEDT